MTTAMVVIMPSDFAWEILWLSFRQKGIRSSRTYTYVTVREMSEVIHNHVFGEWPCLWNSNKHPRWRLLLGFPAAAAADSAVHYHFTVHFILFCLFLVSFCFLYRMMMVLQEILRLESNDIGRNNAANHETNHSYHKQLFYWQQHSVCKKAIFCL